MPDPMTLPATMVEAAAALRAGRLTATTLTTLSLEAIATHNPATRAFITVDADGALAAAGAADAELAAGFDRGPLHGLPLSVKDLIDVAGHPTTAASRVCADRVAGADAPIVSRLKAAGAVIVGKTNLHEFALGTTSEDSAWGPVLHPADRTRVAGGSSGGSAVAVALGLGLASIGTDTGGSIRIPAAACGVVGLKPSLRDVPTAGIIPLSTTLDHAGPLARSVQDASWLWSVLAGQPLHAPAPIDLRHLRLGRLTGYFADPVEAVVRSAIDDACARLREAGVTLTEVELPGTDRIVDTYVNMVLPEGAAWHAPWLDSRRDDYSPTVRARLAAGRDIPAVDYVQARAQRERLAQAVDALLWSVDALVLPTLPIVAPALGQERVIIDSTDIPVRSAMLKHTQTFNITGHPAISIPVRSSGLPVGLQLAAARDATPRLIDIAAACETALCL